VALVILAGALLFSAVVRWRLREFPLERDEGGYAYMGQLLLQGIPPYQEAYNDKLPGLYLAYAAIMAAFGQTTAGIHLGLLTVNLATIVLIFLLVRDLFDPLAGGIAAASYSLMAVSPSVLGMAAHATHFVNLFAVAATWALWRALKSEKLPLLFLSGLLFGTAFLMKHQGAFLCGFGAVVTLAHYALRRPFSWRKLLACSVVFGLGVVVPYATTCFWLWRAGVFNRFWFWTVVYARGFAQQVPFRTGMELFWGSSGDIATANWPLLIAALLGALLLGSAKSAGRLRWFVLAYFAFSFLSVCSGSYYRPHYFVVPLVAVAILSGVGGSWMIDWAGRPVTNEADRGRRRSFSWPVVVVLLMGGAIVICQQWEFFFWWTPTQACREVYGWAPFVESPLIAEYVSRHSTPDQRVAVLGSEPEVYFYARRRAATGHLFAYPLTEQNPFALKLQEEMCREIEAAKPEFLVVFDNSTSWWMVVPDRNRFVLDWSARYLNRYYRPVGLADTRSSRRIDYLWDKEAAEAKPRGDTHVWVFRRKR
jgi:4-amino-4-deoxy-L-arabinose transferase-like glycosyltransferase